MEKKKNLRLRVRISVACVWLGALVAMLTKIFGSWCLLAGMGIAAVAAIYRYTMIRCPRCGHKLVDGETLPPLCPKCGEELV